VAPLAAALAEHLPRRTLLVTLDLVRAAVAMMLPFVSQIWQVYVLIFVLQASSAAFTPTFQATLPDLLPPEGDYTKALSLSRMASAALLVSVVMPPPPAPQHLRPNYAWAWRALWHARDNGHRLW
jgi:MFS family permease